MLGIVVVSGLPASGKSSLANALGANLGWQVLDKDRFLVDLFCSRGVGDDAWRTVLSREADALFQGAVESSRTTVACSWWRHPKSAEASGTPIDWLATLPAPIVEIHCECSPAVAKARFFNRTRHPGRSAYHSHMRVATGTVISGKVVLDEPSLTDGTDVFVVTREQEDVVHLSPEELAELEAGLAEADRDETISGKQLFDRLRRFG